MSRNKLRTKYLASLLGSFVVNREIFNKKNGHNHTYTHLNNRNSDKYSEVQSNISTKEPKMNRLRQSKSPNKKVNMELGTCIVFLRIVICVVQSQICESIVLSEFASSWIY